MMIGLFIKALKGQDKDCFNFFLFELDYILFISKKNKFFRN